MCAVYLLAFGWLCSFFFSFTNTYNQKLTSDHNTAAVSINSSNKGSELPHQHQEHCSAMILLFLLLFYMTIIAQIYAWERDRERNGEMRKQKEMIHDWSNLWPFLVFDVCVVLGCFVLGNRCDFACVYFFYSPVKQILYAFSVVAFWFSVVWMWLRIFIVFSSNFCLPRYYCVLWMEAVNWEDRCVHLLLENSLKVPIILKMEKLRILYMLPVIVAWFFFLWKLGELSNRRRWGENVHFAFKCTYFTLNIFAVSDEATMLQTKHKAKQIKSTHFIQ